MMNKNEFLRTAPRNKADFINKYRADRVFRNNAKALGFRCINNVVTFPDGSVAGVHCN